MAACDRYIELISARLDGALSPEEALELEAHLARCGECRALALELEQLRRSLQDLPPVEVPADLQDRIMAAVRADNVTPLVPQKASAYRWRKWAASAAVLAVILLGAGYLGLGGLDLGRTGNTAPAADRSGVISIPGLGNTDVSAMKDSGYSPDTLAGGDASQENGISPQAIPEPACVSVEPASRSMPIPAAAPEDAPAEEEFPLSLPQAVEKSGDTPEICQTSDDLPAQTEVPDPADISDPKDSQIVLTAMPRMFSTAPAGYQLYGGYEATHDAPVTSPEDAVNVLANYIYELVDQVTPLSDGLNINYFVNSPTGAAGTVTLAEETECAYLLNYQDSEDAAVLNYAVDKATGAVTLLEQEEAGAISPASDAEDTGDAPACTGSFPPESEEEPPLSSPTP